MYTNFSKCLRAETKEMAMYVEKNLKHWHNTDVLSQYVIGTSIPNFDTKSLLKSKIILPPKDIINKFSKIQNLYFETLYNEEKNRLVSIRDKIHPKLMSGEISV